MAGNSASGLDKMKTKEIFDKGNVGACRKRGGGLPFNYIQLETTC